jgi:hypothetical protein
LNFLDDDEVIIEEDIEDILVNEASAANDTLTQNQDSPRNQVYAQQSTGNSMSATHGHKTTLLRSLSKAILYFYRANQILTDYMIVQ